MPDVSQTGGRIRPISRFWYVSPLTRRILAVNVAALLVLALGLLYTGQYERGLIASEIEAVQARGQVYASMLAAAATRPSTPGEPTLAGDLARQMVRGLGVRRDVRILVFNKAGRLALDSRDLQEPLAPPSASVASVVGRVLDLLPGALEFEAFPATGDGWPGVAGALQGAAQQGIWSDPAGGILLTAALPVQGPKSAIGAVLVIRDGKAIEDATRAVQMTVLRAFAVALVVTVLFSIYLSESIVYPIVRLAVATERVQESLLHRDSIPDLSWRKDEIGDLSRAFRDMTAALETRIDSISRFAADVAHEIKNPLASVKSAVETFPLVRDEAQRNKLLAVMNDDVNRMSRLITDISNASRLDSELARAARRTFDLAALLKDVVAAENARLSETGKTPDGSADKIVLYAEEGRRLPVTGNEIQLSQVVHNLIDNALSFVTAAGKVAISAGLKGDKVYMHVDNAGPPIPEDKLEMVFERFYSERPKSEKFGLHSGLGLSISRQITRMHRGEITAQNLKDKAGVPQGVRFTMILPAGAGTK
jgi:two-component system sensor histidine kinase ChvG